MKLANPVLRQTDRQTDRRNDKQTSQRDRFVFIASAMTEVMKWKS